MYLLEPNITIFHYDMLNLAEFPWPGIVAGLGCDSCRSASRPVWRVGRCDRSDVTRALGRSAEPTARTAPRPAPSLACS